MSILDSGEEVEESFTLDQPSGFEPGAYYRITITNEHDELSAKCDNIVVEPASSAQSAPLHYEQFHKELEAWVDSEGAGARVRETAELIEKAFRSESTTLHLPFQRLRTLPTVIGELRHLREFSVHSHELTTLPPQIGQLEMLEKLNFSSCRLTDLPAELVQLKWLKELDLSQNQLEVLPPVIGQLKRLKELRLSFNRLRTLPPQISKLLMLERLELERNQLTELPPEIGELMSLQRLDLSGNQLKILPAQIRGLYRLKTLILSFNTLIDLPDGMSGPGELPCLQELQLSGNRKLSELPVDFSMSLDITEIDISETLISPDKCDLILAMIRKRRDAEALRTDASKA